MDDPHEPFETHGHDDKLSVCGARGLGERLAIELRNRATEERRVGRARQERLPAGVAAGGIDRHDDVGMDRREAFRPQGRRLLERGRAGEPHRAGDDRERLVAKRLESVEWINGGG